ncbi:YeiH family protein [Enterococcus sp. BWR-S5]|uniref:YeiH family protein n=1 Tax=Enterococcus sp. BWR-S5 TaxID=2787714 RepID=UPI0019234A37|nr:putative sulfate exporter family transporter [Enterococcus sp. BWR-S5]MBL1225155.1 putative sulfate exporter family transporter [Enterococcus sp. BWR-S5]
MKFRSFLESITKNSLVSGVILSFLVALISKGLAIFLPQLGGATIAILLGIVFGNTMGNQDLFDKGTKFSESKLLEISVVLLGATVTFQTVAEIGIKGVIFIVLLMSGTILFTYKVGKLLCFNQSMALMMAGGNAVCGSSAIASIAPVIGAKDEEKGQIITLVNLLGTIMMLTLPFIGLALFGDGLIAKSALLGGTLQSVGQVVAGASLLNEEVVQFAMLFKILRILLLVVVVFVFEKWASRTAVPQETTAVGKSKKKTLPWYVTGFLVVCIINSVFHIPALLSESAHFVSGWCEVTALAAIGLRLNLKKFLKEGPKFMIYGLSVGAFQTIGAIVLIFLLLKG